MDRSAEEAQQYVEITHARMPRFIEHLEALALPLDGARVLDLGSGPGVWALAMRTLGACAVVCHDMSSVFIEQARRLHLRCGVDGMEYQQRDLTDLSYPDESFDIVFCRLALPFASDEDWTISEIARVLRPGGSFYALIPSWRATFRGGRLQAIKGIAKFGSPLLSPFFSRKLTSTFYSTAWATERYARRAGLRREWLRFPRETRQNFEVLYSKPDGAAMTTEQT